MSAQLPEFVERLIIDGTRVGWHRDRIAAWERGEKIAPVTIDCAMTRACNYACGFCVWPDTLVSMADGSRKRMDEVRAGDWIASVTGDGRPGRSVVTAQWQTSPMQPTLQLVLPFGKLKCTPGHLILTDHGWMPAGALRAGDYVWTGQANSGATDSADVGGGTRSQPAANARKQAWCRSDDAPRTQGKAPPADEAKQPDAKRRGRKEDGRDHQEALRGRLPFQVVQAALAGGQDQGWTEVVPQGAEGHQRPNEDQQSDEEGRRSCPDEVLLYAGTTEGTFGSDEEVVAGRPDYARHVSREAEREGGEQDGAAAVSVRAPAPRPVRRGRYVLDQEHGERHLPEPGLHLRERDGQGGPARPRGLLASGRRGDQEGIARLPTGGLERVCSVDQADQAVDDGVDQDRAPVVVGRAQILAIEDAGSSPVYDLECSPHHNFIAEGVVVHNCYAQLQANEGEGKVTKERFLLFLSDAAEIGVKGVSFISDGESTVVPWYADAVEHAASVGLKVGAGSNGYKLTKPVLERVLPHLSYLRFNFSAGERHRYSEIMGVPPAYYDAVIQNIRDGMEIINRDGLACTLNVQLVLDPKDGDQIIPFAKLVAELRPTYGVIKHCADDSFGTLGVDYSKYAALQADLERAEEIGREAGVRITAKWDKIKSGGKRSYDRCMGSAFIMQVSGSGLVANCGFHFNERFRKFHMGSIVTERFRDIWASDRYDEILRYLASDQFNPQERCGSLCLQDSVNKFLYEYQGGRIALPTTAAPPHIEFV